MSGLELSRRLAAVKHATPVVFITAHDEAEVRAEAESSGCAGYFRKTDSGASVLEAIHKAVHSVNRKRQSRPPHKPDP
jgi:FixJ family two-component response regulator